MQELLIVDDYHDFDLIADSFNDPIKVKEIGVTRVKGKPYTVYVGIIYRGNEPDENEIQEILSENGISLTNNFLEEKSHEL